MIPTTEPICDKFDYCRGIGRGGYDSSCHDETFEATGMAVGRPGFYVAESSVAPKLAWAVRYPLPRKIPPQNRFAPQTRFS